MLFTRYEISGLCDIRQKFWKLLFETNLWTQNFITTNKNYLNSFAIESTKDNSHVIFFNIGPRD